MNTNKSLCSPRFLCDLCVSAVKSPSPPPPNARPDEQRAHRKNSYREHRRFFQGGVLRFGKRSRRAERSLVKTHLEDLREVNGDPISLLADHFAATETVSDDQLVFGRTADGGQQGALAAGEANIVVVRFVAE